MITITTPTSVATTDYLGGYQYKNTVLQFFPTAEGYVKNTPVSGTNTYSYVLNYTDHLGNTRLSYTKDVSGSLKIFTENGYYPFGLTHKGYNNLISTNNPAEKLLFNGKELQDELGLNMIAMDYRQYDNTLGRFMCIDPLAEMKYDSSPFRFGFNNPNFWSDPSGLFETRKEAREYKNEHHIKGSVTKNDDGSFSINDKKNNVSYFKPEAGLGVSTVNSDGVASSPLVVGEAKVNNIISTGKTANDYSGLGATALEASPGAFRLTTVTRGFSPKFYANAWTGNGFANTYNISKIGKGLGLVGTVTGTALDGFGVLNYYNPKYGPNSPNSVHPGKATTNLGMAAYGYYVNPIPAVLYSAVDMFYPGGWTGDAKNPGLANDQARLDQENKAINPNWQFWPGAMKQ